MNYALIKQEKMSNRKDTNLDSDSSDEKKNNSGLSQFLARGNAIIAEASSTLEDEEEEEQHLGITTKEEESDKTSQTLHPPALLTTPTMLPNINDADTSLYTWKSQNYKTEIDKLLSGKPALFKSDVLKIKSKYSTRVNMIEIRLIPTNVRSKETLEKSLKDFDIVLTQIGNSHYKCKDVFYAVETSRKISLEYSLVRDENGIPLRMNKAYEDMRHGFFLISPYTTWQIQLINKNNDNKNKAQNLLKLKNDINVELIGRGTINNSEFLCDFSKYPTQTDVSLKNSEMKVRIARDLDVFYQDDFLLSTFTGDVVAVPTVVSNNEPANPQITQSVINVSPGFSTPNNYSSNNSSINKSINNNNNSPSNSSLEDNALSSGATRSFSSPINDIFNYVKVRFASLSFMIQNQFIQTPKSHEYSNDVILNNPSLNNNHLSTGFSTWSINNSLVLADLLIRNMTKEKHNYEHEKSIVDNIEAQGVAISITKEIEDIIENASIIEERIDYDVIAVQSKLLKLISTNRISQITSVLRNLLTNHVAKHEVEKLTNKFEKRVQKLLGLSGAGIYKNMFMPYSVPAQITII